MHTLLVNSFLPDAFNMREDRVSNVRLTLVAALKVMPEDILEKKETQTILTTLEEEMKTWDSGFGEPGEVDGSGGSMAGASTVTRSTAPASSASSSQSSKRQTESRGGRDKSKSKKSDQKNHSEDDKPSTPGRRGKCDRVESGKKVQDEKSDGNADAGQQNPQVADEDDDNHSLSSI